jgi:YD repeat-containing protein
VLAGLICADLRRYRGWGYAMEVDSCTIVLGSGSGAFMSTSTDAAVEVAGGPLTVTRSYRSLDSTVRALGTGWTSLLDMSVSTPPEAAGPVVRFADGHEESFAANPNGTFAGAPGNVWTSLTRCADCTAWMVTDDQGVKYVLDTGGLISITSRSGNTVTITRDAAGKPSLMKDPLSGRILALTWAGAHVTAIAAQPAPAGVASTWTY